MSDDDIRPLDEYSFQIVFKDALKKVVLKQEQITELGDKLDSLDGPTFLMFCSQKKEETMNELMNFYQIEGPLAYKIYANLIAKRNTNQSKGSFFPFFFFSIPLPIFSKTTSGF